MRSILAVMGIFFWAVHFMGPCACGADLCWLGACRTREEGSGPRGCCKEAPQNGGGLKQRKRTPSQFWRPDVQNQGHRVEIKASAGGALGGRGSLLLVAVGRLGVWPCHTGLRPRGGTAHSSAGSVCEISLRLSL